jgi:hypothetical protein
VLVPAVRISIKPMVNKENKLWYDCLILESLPIDNKTCNAYYH